MSLNCFEPEFDCGIVLPVLLSMLLSALVSLLVSVVLYAICVGKCGIVYRLCW